MTNLPSLYTEDCPRPHIPVHDNMLELIQCNPQKLIENIKSVKPGDIIVHNDNTLRIVKYVKKLDRETYPILINDVTYTEQGCFSIGYITGIDIKNILKKDTYEHIKALYCIIIPFYKDMYEDS